MIGRGVIKSTKPASVYIYIQESTTVLSVIIDSGSGNVVPVSQTLQISHLAGLNCDSIGKRSYRFPEKFNGSICK